MHFTWWELVVKMWAHFIYNASTPQLQIPFLYPPLPQLGIYQTKCAHIHSCMLANLVLGTQIICLERTGNVI